MKSRIKYIIFIIILILNLTQVVSIANTDKNKTLENGIYKIAVGRKPNEIMEIAYSSKYNNEKAEIWSDYGDAQAQKFYLEYQKQGYYKIIAMHSGKCLTVKDNNIKAGAAIVQYEYKGLDSQKWCLRDSGKNGWVITPLSNSKLAISVEGKIQNGSRLILSNTQDNDNQMFYMFNISSKEKKHADGVYKIAVGRKPNEIMEIAYSSIYNNEKVEIWNDYGDAPAQKFYLEYQKEGYYKITAVHSGKSLTVKDNNIKAGAAIVQNEYQGLDSQKWYLRDSRKNGWIITPLSNPQLAISVEGKIQNGSRLILSNTQDNDNQMFYMFNISAKEKKHENGIYKIAVGRKPNEIMEIAYSSKYNNEKAEIWSDYGNAQAQKFYLEYQKQGYYKITAMHSGKSLTVKNNNIKAGAAIVQNEYQGLDSQKWYLRDSGKNGWIITPLSNPQLAISVEGKIQNGSRLILSKTQDNDNQMFYMFNISAKEKKQENGKYKFLVGADSKKGIEISEGKNSNNINARIWDYRK